MICPNLTQIDPTWGFKRASLPAMRKICLVMVLLMLAAGCGGGDDSPSPKRPPAAAKEPPKPKFCPLTGKEAPKDLEAQRPALAAKLDNSPPGRPQAGLESADIVYEELAEGGITRFLAIFTVLRRPVWGLSAVPAWWIPTSCRSTCRTMKEERCLLIRGRRPLS